jgi:hypothetical protein
VLLPLNQLSDGVLGVVAVGLAFLRAVDTAEADAFSIVAVQYFDGVAIDHANDLAGEVGRKAQNRTQQKEVNEPRNCCG